MDRVCDTCKMDNFINRAIEKLEQLKVDILLDEEECAVCLTFNVLLEITERFREIDHEDTGASDLEE